MEPASVKILLIDDDEDDFIITSTLLSEAGEGQFAFEWCSSYEKALDLIQKQKHDAYLIDYNLGARNGIELIREASSKGCKAPMILLTGQGAHHLDMETMKSGAVFYLVKGQTNAALLERSIRYAIERKNVEEALRESRERYELAVNGARDGIWDLKLATSEVYYSQRWKAMIGYGDHEIGSTLSEWMSRVHPEDVERLKKEMALHTSGQTPFFETEYRIMHKDGVYRWVLSRGTATFETPGKATRMAGSQTDISSRKRDAALLEQQAFFDALTNLPNRVSFMHRLNRAVGRLKWKENDLFAVLFLDIDRFKAINDSMGHAVGDQLLIAISRRLESCLRPGDFVARFGGDEFTMLTEDIRDIGDVTRIAARVRQQLTLPFRLENQEAFIDVSIGIALSSEAERQPEDLLQDADLAMYRAKTLGKGRFEFYNREMRIRAMQFLQLDYDLRRAVERQEFRLHYQPIVSLDERRVTGIEALVYWQHPRRGRLYPAEFIQQAEETGIILALEEWIIKAACAQNKAWQDAKLAPLRMMINCSVRQFQNKGFINLVKETLQAAGLGPEWLGIEISEGCALQDIDASLATLEALNALGIEASIDDYGTGFSSLFYLKRFPVRTLKIDRSFIGKISEDADAKTVISAVIAMAHALKLKVVAEGVETETQLSFLESQHCDYFQGNLYCQPLPERTLTRLMQEGHFLSREFKTPAKPRARKPKET